MVADAKAAEKVLRSVADQKSDGRKSRGRPKAKASKTAVAAAIGVSKTTLIEAEHQTETAEEFPFMQGWRQSEVLAVREELRLLTTAGRARPENALSARLRLRRPRAIVW
jgi:hypothetical protein